MRAASTSPNTSGCSVSFSPTTSSLTHVVPKTPARDALMASIMTAGDGYSEVPMSNRERSSNS
jgi:hypothetical protein